MTVKNGHNGGYGVKVQIDQTDRRLLELLEKNSRISVSDLSRKLSLSRSTVKDRIERLESRDVVAGYTLRYSDAYRAQSLQAHVMISVDPKKTTQIVSAIYRIKAVSSLHTVSGSFDMLAIVTSDTTTSLDMALDEIGALDGVERTLSFIILSTKYER